MVGWDKDTDTDTDTQTHRHTDTQTHRHTDTSIPSLGSGLVAGPSEKDVLGLIMSFFQASGFIRPILQL